MRRWSPLICVAFLACSGSSESTDSDEGEIIGGEPDATSNPAVGALVDVFEMANGTGYREFCTATLVAPRVVITAEHCFAHEPRAFAFVTGATATTDFSTGRGPDRVVLAERYQAEQTVTGGGLGLGSDVAVVFLQQPITDVKPLPIGALSTADIGKKFTAIGYGRQADGTHRGERRSGQVVLKALRGSSVAPVVSFEDFHRASGGERAENREAYDAPLLEGYEALVAADGAQPCDGDSGGPLLRKRGNQVHVFGVTSFTRSSADEECTFGAVYATFGPAAKALVDAAVRPD